MRRNRITYRKIIEMSLVSAYDALYIDSSYSLVVRLFPLKFEIKQKCNILFNQVLCRKPINSPIPGRCY